MKKRNIKKIIIKLVTIFISIIFYSYLCMVLTPKNVHDKGGTSFYRGMGFLAEKKNSLDIVVFGNSDVYSGFSPVELYKKYNYKSYASGSARQTIGKINNLLDRSLKKQKPKLVIFEVDCLYEKSKKPITGNSFFLAPFMYHSRWKNIKTRDFFTFPDRRKKKDITKGFVFSKKVFKNNPGNYMGSKDSVKKPVPKHNYKYLKLFIKKLRDNKIDILFIEFPSATSWNYSKHNYIKEFAKKENINFLDLNIETKKYKADFSKEFRDNGNHMNVYGAKRATLYIGEYIKENYPSLNKIKSMYKKNYSWENAVKYYENKLKEE